MGLGAERFRDVFAAAGAAGGPPLPGEEFLAVGVGRVASALSRAGGELDPSPRYLRRHPGPVTFTGGGSEG